MRLRFLLPLLLCSACGGPAPVDLCADGGCDRAFQRIVFVEMSTPGGNFRVLRDGLSVRHSFANGLEDRGQTLTREQLAPLWLAVDEPAFHLDLHNVQARDVCNDFRTQRCLDVSVKSTATTGGCWCGPASEARVENAWQEALAVFDLAFPGT
ncbi:MAG: hypothetical protein AB1938_19675 [Myxococcota bacterium]